MYEILLYREEKDKNMRRVILGGKAWDWIEVKQERNGVVHDEIVGQWIKVFGLRIRQPRRRNRDR